MFLSLLDVNVGGDPDRPRPGRLWLRNRYRVHQRLCMGFPDQRCIADDAEFLQPFDPRRFACGDVHVAREPDGGFLFRVDPLAGGRVMILIQSARKPDWDYAFQNASYLLAAPPSGRPQEWRTVDQGTRLKFRLDANPTKRLHAQSRYANGEPVSQQWVGKRVPVPVEAMHDWLTRRAQQSGFSVERFDNVQPGFVYFNKTRDRAKGQQLRSARYDGILEVTDPECFRETLIHGIGPAKAFGFGLLSVAPVR